MIARDHNRAALIIYSVANETPSAMPGIISSGNSFRSAFSRPHPAVVCRSSAREVADGKHITIHINDPIGSDLDVIGNNEYIGCMSPPGGCRFD